MNANVASKHLYIVVNEQFVNKHYQTQELGVSYELRVSFRSNLFHFFLQSFVRKNTSKENLTNTILIANRIMNR